ncbi:hypothetical protein EAO82_07045 [Halopseudomonas pelagia]|uniref:Uncharacterized protein n=1 Tax=Halopseudomonas pelagia TaxID=553151 RepID=A0AA91Z4K3_9GAMM|nr:hypothetical protein CO192_18355 [Halopseudomonas pelagia]QFY56143.1 hypothetical protein EAO82_07045 [Halopseudomonas pelagia]
MDERTRKTRSQRANSVLHRLFMDLDIEDSLSARQMKKPQRKLGLFHLCGEKTDETPHGSTSLRQQAKNGVAKLQRWDCRSSPKR